MILQRKKFPSISLLQQQPDKPDWKMQHIIIRVIVFLYQITKPVFPFLSDLKDPLVLWGWHFSMWHFLIIKLTHNFKKSIKASKVTYEILKGWGKVRNSLLEHLWIKGLTLTIRRTSKGIQFDIQKWNQLHRDYLNYISSKPADKVFKSQMTFYRANITSTCHLRFMKCF